MFRRLKQVRALSEDVAFILRTHIASYNHLSLHFQGMRYLFWSSWAPDIHTVHRHTYKQTFTRIK